MFKKTICVLLAFYSVAVMLTGCGKKATTTTVVNNGSQSSQDIQAGQKGNGHISDEIDLKLCAKNVSDKFLNSDYGLNDISIEPPGEENNFFNIIFVADKKPEDENIYIEWLEECLTALNDEAIKQDPEFKVSSEGYYGGLFDQYSVCLSAMCLDEILTRWPVNQRIEAGTHDPIVTNNDIIDLNALGN